MRTILFNAQAAFNDDRMSAQELRGWTGLASRVLHTIPAADEGPVAEALTAVTELVPRSDGSAAAEIAAEDAFASEPAQAAADELFTVCEDAGFEVIMTGFVGG